MKVAKLSEEQMKQVFSANILERGEASVGHFQECWVERGDIYGKIIGNHGVYTPKLVTSKTAIEASCNCKPSTEGPCKHAAALGLNYIFTPWEFKCIDKINRSTLNSMDEIQFYVALTPLRNLVEELKAKNITLAQLADATRLSVQQVSAAVKDSDQKINNHLSDVLKMACLYLLENKGLKS